MLTSSARKRLLYLSYNTLPGWHLKRIVRDMFTYYLQDNVQSPQVLEQVVEYFQHVTHHAKGIHRHLLEIASQTITKRMQTIFAMNTLKKKIMPFM